MSVASGQKTKGSVNVCNINGAKFVFKDGKIKLGLKTILYNMPDEYSYTIEFINKKKFRIILDGCVIFERKGDVWINYI